MMNQLEMAMLATIAELDAMGFVAWPMPEKARDRIRLIEEDMQRAYLKWDEESFMRLLNQWDLEYKTNQP